MTKKVKIVVRAGSIGSAEKQAKAAAEQSYLDGIFPATAARIYWAEGEASGIPNLMQPAAGLTVASLLKCRAEEFGR